MVAAAAAALAVAVEHQIGSSKEEAVLATAAASSGALTAHRLQAAQLIFICHVSVGCASHAAV
jgi:hypothetical protein